jgi:hypothetical protein
VLVGTNRILSPSGPDQGDGYCTYRPPSPSQRSRVLGARRRERQRSQRERRTLQITARPSPPVNN